MISDRTVILRSKGASRSATAGIHGRPIVFYCLADCWMSWNAAKGAASWGTPSFIGIAMASMPGKQRGCRPRMQNRSLGL